MSFDEMEYRREQFKRKIFTIGIGIWILSLSLFFMSRVLEDTVETLKEDDVIEIGVVTNITEEKNLFGEKYILTIETEKGRYVKSISDETKVLYNVGSEVVITRNEGEDSILRIELSENRSNVK